MELEQNLINYKQRLEANGILHPRFGIARDLVRFSNPSGFPNFCQLSLPLCNTSWLTDPINELNSRESYYGSSFETDFHRSITAAVGEAMERYSASLYCDACLIEGTSAELLDCDWPSDCIRFSQNSYNKNGFPYPRYDPEISRYWIAAKNVSKNTPTYMPAQIGIFAFPPNKERPLQASTTSGFAAGIDKVSATVSGLLEVIERDAFVLHWLLEKAGTKIRVLPESFGDEQIFSELLNVPGIYIEAVALHSDLNVPVVVAMVHGKRTGATAFGASARLTYREALRKAVLEAAHTFTYLTACRGANIPLPSKSKISSFLDHAYYYSDGKRRSDLLFLSGNSDDALPLTELERTALVEISSSSDPQVKLDYLINEISERGYDVIVADRTPEDVASLGYSTVKVVVPGLHPIWVGKWVCDDMRRIDSYARSFNLSAPLKLNRRPHPFP